MTPTEKMPVPFPADGPPDHSPYGYGTRNGDFEGTYYAPVYFTKTTGNTIIFDPATNRASDSTPSGSGYTIVKKAYKPEFMNRSGRTVGTDLVGGPPTGVVVPPHVFTAPSGSGDLSLLGEGEVTGLSDDDRAIIVKAQTVNNNTIYDGHVQSVDGTTTFDFNAALASTTLHDYASVYPFLISNHNQTDQSYSVMTSASDGGDPKTLLWKYDPVKHWQPLEVQLPQGVSVQMKSINSSGIIAAIGLTGTGAGHALLLLPVTVTVATTSNNIWQDQTADNHAVIRTPAVQIYATYISLPGATLQLKIAQDVKGGMVFSYDDGTESTSLTRSDPTPNGPFDFVADVGPIEFPEVLSFAGINVCKFTDNPDFTIGRPPRQHVMKIHRYAEFNDFVTVSVNGGSSQTIAEVNWKFDVEANFDPNPRSTPSNPLPTVAILPINPSATPPSGATAYGIVPFDPPMVSNRQLTANSEFVNPLNWAPSGPANGFAAKHRYPRSDMDPQLQ